MGYFVYILRCAGGTLYTGSARDVDARTAAHNAGSGAKYTRARLPVDAVYRERCPDKGAALSREHEIKQLSHVEKEALVQSYRQAVPLVSQKPSLTLSDFQTMSALERLCYAEDYITPPEEAYAWYQKSPDSTVAFYTESGELAGFINLLAIQKEAFCRFENGSFNDKFLTAEDLLLPDDPGPCGAFFSCIAVSPRYRGTGLPLMLIRAAVKRYQTMENRFSRIVLDAATPGGAHLAERLGLRYLLNSDHGTRIYSGSYRTFCRRAEQLAPTAP